jgi:hypothetical protein
MLFGHGHVMSSEEIYQKTLYKASVNTHVATSTEISNSLKRECKTYSHTKVVYEYRRTLDQRQYCLFL